jgi:hypothetical protein
LANGAFDGQKRWKQALLDGTDPNNPPKIVKPIPAEILENRPDKEKAHKALHAMVMHLINTGQAHLLYECGEVIDYFGGRIPDPHELQENDVQPVCEFF